MRVRYAGVSSTGVEVVHPDPAMPDANTVTVCPHGAEVDLPDDIALSQMASGQFEPADNAAKTALRRHTRAATTAAADVDEPPAASDDTSTEET